MEVAVIADELTALGWRLAGARTFAGSPQTIASSFQTAQEEADLILISAQLAALLPQASLQAALHSFPPLTLLIGDLRGEQEPPDLALEARRALGVLP
ncbi:MAG TPA: V-type ATP synthase subunit F [Steroidobacteraceae bacterium]|nr:V-type ATP synthase subunit F [Steroidobacteraceae bacterium]